MNVSNLIRRPVQETPGKTAIIFEDRLIPYAELDTLINRTAEGLLDLGLKRGEVLSLFLPSLPELIIAYLGAVGVGVTVNVVNAMLREQEVAYILKDCRSRAVLTDAQRLPIIESLRSEVPSLTVIIPLKNQEGKNYPAFESWLAERKGLLDAPETKGGDLCHLM